MTYTIWPFELHDKPCLISSLMTMWSFHDKVLSIIIPKNLVLLILVIIKFVIVIWNAICFYYYYYYYYYINWRKVVLLQFSDRRLLLNHSIISFMTKIVLFLNSSGFVFDIMILVSSANSTELANLFIADGKSLIYIYKKKQETQYRTLWDTMIYAFPCRR